MEKRFMKIKYNMKKLRLGIFVISSFLPSYLFVPLANLEYLCCAVNNRTEK